MHECFDEEVDCDDNAVTIINSTSKKELGINQDVFRVYFQMRRRGTLWTSTTKIRILKGASRNQSKDLYATLECFISEGLERDPGETKMICRLIDIPEAEGSTVSYDSGNPIFKLGKSRSFPVELLSSDKCIRVSEDIWRKQDEKRSQKLPGYIEILDTEQVKQFSVDKGLSPIVKAGTKPPNEIIAIIRPKRFLTLLQEGRCDSRVDKKTVVKDLLEMRLEVKLKVYPNSHYFNPSMPEEEDIGVILSQATARNNVQGLYCFSMDGLQFQNIFTKAGIYVFSFSLVQNTQTFLGPAIAEVEVLPSEKVGRWSICDHPGECSSHHPHENSRKMTVRIGGRIGPLYISCFDKYGNVKKITDSLDLRFEIWQNNAIIPAELQLEFGDNRKIQEQNMWLIQGLYFKKADLKLIKPSFQAMLRMFVCNNFATELPLKLLPGKIHHMVVVESEPLDNMLRPGAVISVLMLKGLDVCSNSVDKGEHINLELAGLMLQDNKGAQREVDEEGCLNLGGLLKVTGPFNSEVEICVYSDDLDQLFWKRFALIKRKLKLRSKLLEEQLAGTILRDLAVVVVDENEEVDRSMEGALHTITVSTSKDCAYPLNGGSCHIPGIKLPSVLGKWSFYLFHSAHNELQIEIKLDILPPLTVATGSETAEGGLMLEYYKNDEVEKLNIIAGNIIENIEKYQRKLEVYAAKVTIQDEALQKLTVSRAEIENDIYNLKDHIQKLNDQLHELQRNKPKCESSANIDTEEYTKDSLLRNIRALQDHPTSILLQKEIISTSLYKSTGKSVVKHEILGPVAVLTSVENKLLSRVLSEFLGQDNMLAVLCSSLEAVSLLESHLTTSPHRLRAYVLSEMSVFDAVESSHQQKLLKIVPPMLNDGSPPKGFIGYAVNLLSMDSEYLTTNSMNQHSIRQTLFYGLFSTLQVYETRDNLLNAREALKTGGVSLDGGLVRGKDCMDLGFREESSIIFPVVSHSASLLDITCQSYQVGQIQMILKLKEEEIIERKQMLMDIARQVEYRHMKRKNLKDKFDATKEKILKEEQHKVQVAERIALLQESSSI